MAIFNWSALTNGQNVTFDPNADVLNFDDIAISATSVSFSFANSNSGPFTFRVAAKSVNFSSVFSALTTTNLTFANGSRFLVGDNTTAIGGGGLNDDAANTLTGTSGADQFVGLGGADILNGGDGDDSFATAFATSNFGNDTVNGGNGFDLLSFRGSVNSVNVNFATLLATSVQGNLTLSSIESVIGSSAGDTLTGSNRTDTSEQFSGMAGNDVIDGQGGTDEVRYDRDADSGGVAGVVVNLSTGTAIDGFGNTDNLSNIEGVRGTAQSDTLTGNSFSNFFYGLAGNDAIDGGGGFDDIKYDRDSLYGGLNGITATFSSAQGGTVIDGFGNNDTFSNIERVIGTAFSDSFIGTVGTQQFAGLAGNDTLNGGADFDWADYSTGGNAGVTVNLGTGTATDDFGNTDSLINIEGVFGSRFADTIVGSNANNVFVGYGGNDSFDGGSGGFDEIRYSNDILSGGLNGIVATFTSAFGGTVVDGFGNTDTFSNIDVVAGTGFVDTFNGTTGTQQFRGLAGNDVLNGGADFDWADYSNDSSFVGGGNGITALLTSGAVTDGYGNTDTLIGIEGVIGTGFVDTITGDANNNNFYGGFGNDVLNGGNGFDTLNYSGSIEFGAFGVTVDLQTGTATDTFGNTDTISNFEQVNGSNFNDTIRGRNVGETLIGNSGADILIGRDGRDFLRGGSGNDTLDGSVVSEADQSSGDSDTAAFNDAGITQGVIVNLNLATATDGFGNTDTLIDIERLRGTSFVDTLTGSDTQNLRQERFQGLAGNDTIDGRAGFDYASYDADTGNGGAGGVTVNLQTGTATDGFGNTDTLLNIEGVIATTNNDVLTGNAQNNAFRTNGGTDLVDGGVGIDALSLYFDDQIGGTGSIVDMVAGTATQVSGGVVTFTSIEEIDGSYRDDTITGSANNERLFGDLGNDTINGSDGDDTIGGGAGVDSLNGGNGVDWLSFVFDVSDPVDNGVNAAATVPSFGWLTQNWNWTGVTVNLATGAMSGLDGAVDTFTNFENVDGTYYDDNITGDGNDNTFRGRSGNDTLNGAGGSDTVTFAPIYSITSGLYLANMTGDVPNGVTVDLAVGYALDGLGFVDTLISIENVIGSIGNDFIQGNGLANRLTGGDGADSLYGYDGDDTLSGGATLVGQYNYLFGGNGSDTADYSDQTVAVFVEMTNGLGYINNGGLALTDVLNQMENVTGGSGNDTLYGNDSAGNVLRGGAGADLLYGLGGDDTLAGGSVAAGQYNYLFGGNGVDTADYSSEAFAIYADLRSGIGYLNPGSGLVLTDIMYDMENLNGGAGSDTLIGNDSVGNVLRGGAGSDVLYGFDGNDTLSGGSVSAGQYNYLFGGNGADTADYSGEAVAIYADLRFGIGYMNPVSGLVLTDIMFDMENLTGGSGNDTLIGSDTAGNVLRGGAGTDVIFGYAGNDTLAGGSALVGQYNYLLGGADSDVADYSESTTGVYADIGGSFGMVKDSGGAYVLTDIYNSIEGITGGGGSDVLFGDSNGNRIAGGFGGDQLYANTGASGDGAQDLIVYSKTTDSNTTTGYDTVYNFVTGQDKVDLTAFHINAASTVISSNAGTTALYVDADSGTAGYEILVLFSGNNAVQSSDLLF